METLTQRRRLFWMTSALGVTLIGVAVILINLLSPWLSWRLDMTATHAYSLSPSSKKLVSGLDDPLVVKAYFSTSLPEPYATYQRYVRDMLSEFRAASHGKVRFEFIPASPADQFERRAMESGMYPLQFEEVGADQLAIRRGFMGLAMFYHDKTETIPVIKNPQQFEYDVVSRILKMTAQKKKIIGYTTGHGEPEWLGPRSTFAQELSTLYEFRPIALPPATTAALAVDALIVAGVTRKLEPDALWTIDQAIMRGTPVAFFVDAKNVMVNRFMVTPNDTGLPELLKTYGVQLGSRLIIDARCETIGLSQNVGGYSFTTQAQYAMIPLAAPSRSPHPLLMGIETLALPFTTSVDGATPPLPGTTFTPLFQSSVRSWLTAPELFNVTPGRIPQPKPDDPRGPFILGGAIEGSFPSFFQGKPSPVKDAAAIPTSPRTALFVAGTSHLLDPDLPAFRGASGLIANLFAWLAKDETLIGIRSKGELLRPLQPVPERARPLIKIAIVAGVPLVAALCGFLRWRRRQNDRRAYSAIAARSTGAV